MQITILTLFPEYFNSILDSSIIKKAIEKNLVCFKIVNIREFSDDKHKTTDDRPFGGGPGMVMKVGPIDRALKSISVSKGDKNKNIVLTSAKGRKFSQNIANNYSKLEDIVIICGHYEGVDERVADNLIDEEIRIGDYVLTGGEPAAAVILDAVTRLIPGTLGNEASNIDESHSKPGELGFPVYTRPSEYNTWKVPEVLLCGNHKDIEEWKQSKKVNQ